MKITELHNQPVQADTYEASMALNQLLKIGKHAIKIHNMIYDSAEMEAWVAKKIDLAGDYVKKVHGYMQGEKAGLYDDGGLTEDADYNNFEKNDEYADNVEKYGDVDKAPLTPQERQQFANWVKQTADVYAEKAMEGVADIGDDPDMIDGDKNLIPRIKAYLKKSYDANDIQGFADAVSNVEKKFGDEDLLMNDTGYQEASDFSQHAVNYLSGFKLLSSKGKDYTVKTIRGVLDHIDDDPHIASAMLLFQQEFEGTPLQKKVSRKQATESVSEDAGEGHMSKSTLYHTAKYAIELMDMINKGDDLEGWVQSKLNKAADYLQGVHNYEEYQKLNPYREELDSNLLQRHAGIIQKNIDEILARETSLDDVDTKPGMMRILAKRVNEVEKEIAKEQRKDTDEEAPPGREKQVKALKKKFKDKGAPYAIAWAQHNKHGKPKKEAEINEDPRAVGKALANLQYGKEMADAILKGKDTMRLVPMAQAYVSGVEQTIDMLNKMYPKEELDEGIKDWAKKTAMAGVIVAGLAGIGSISDAIDNSIPAINAMETALEMAEKSGNDELAKMIEKDLSDAKIRLSSGKDLSHVTDLQNKYAKFIKTEGLAYESKLAVALNQRLK